MSQSIILRVDGVSKKFARGFVGARRTALREIARELTWWDRRPSEELHPTEFWAIRDVSFELRQGESLGIIGANGAGKSTLLKVLSRLLKPDAGVVEIRGRTGALIELGAGFNPILTGRENVFAQGALYGFGARAMASRLESIVDFADVGEAIDKPVQHYSSGMRARLGFAVATHVDPQLLLVDEVLAVGDLAFQNKCMRLMRAYRANGGTIVFVGHAGHQVQAACDRGLVLERGRCAFSGGVVDALDHYFRSQRPEDAAPAPGEGAGEVAGAFASLNTARGVIDDVRIAADGTTARAGERMEIVVRYSAEREHPAALAFGAFYSIDGQRAIAGYASELAGGIAAGPGEIRLQFEQFPFAEGSYQLRVALIDRELGYPIAVRGWFDSATRVTVDASTSAVANFARMIDVPLLLPCTAEVRAR